MNCNVLLYTCVAGAEECEDEVKGKCHKAEVRLTYSGQRDAQGRPVLRGRLRYTKEAIVDYYVIEFVPYQRHPERNKYTREYTVLEGEWAVTATAV